MASLTNATKATFIFEPSQYDEIQLAGILSFSIVFFVGAENFNHLS